MINKVILVGNVGMDPEVRTLESGTKVARLRVATTERIYNRQTQEAKEQTEWHTVTLWAGLADVADRYVHKGSQIYVEGSLRSRKWTDRDGAERTSVEIVGGELKLLGRRGGEGQGTSAPQQHSAQAPRPAAEPVQQPKPEPQPQLPADDVDDLPF